MRKGFTLIELLAVIVILAAILLITVPITKNVIQKSRESSNKASIDLYAKAVENAIEIYQLTNKQNPSKFSDIEEYIKYSGNDVECLTKQLKPDMSIYLANCKVADVLVNEYDYGKLEYIYMWAEDAFSKIEGPTLNEVVNPALYSSMAPTEQNHYLKFKLDEENKVTDGYACIALNDEEYCIKGWDESLYGYSKDPSNYTGNLATLTRIENKFNNFNCIFSPEGHDEYVCGTMTFTDEGTFWNENGVALVTDEAGNVATIGVILNENEFDIDDFYQCTIDNSINLGTSYCTYERY